LIFNISQQHEQNQQTILGIFWRVLPAFKSNDECLTMDFFNFGDKSADLQFLVEKFMDVMLYTIPTDKKGPEAKATASIPGLSRQSVEFITNKQKAEFTFNHDYLRQVKQAILNLLVNDNVTPKTAVLEQKYLIFVIAAIDTYSEVQFLGDSALKRTAKPDFEQVSFVKFLSSLYLGETNHPENSG
jgi:hypothetical protein